jgi:hypothetical protein
MDPYGQDVGNWKNLGFPLRPFGGLPGVIDAPVADLFVKQPQSNRHVWTCSENQGAMFVDGRWKKVYVGPRDPHGAMC